MADKTISALTSASTPLIGSEVLPIVQSGQTVKVTVSNLTAGRAISAKTLNTYTTNLPDNTTLESSTNDGLYVRWKRPNKTYIVALDINNNGGKDFTLFDETAGNPRLSVSDTGDVTVNTGDILIGTADKSIKFSGNSNVIWRVGAGTPEGAVTAPVGSLFTRTDGGANTTLYVKESGAGNTGWVAK